MICFDVIRVCKEIGFEFMPTDNMVVVGVDDVKDVLHCSAAGIFLRYFHGQM